MPSQPVAEVRAIVETVPGDPPTPERVRAVLWLADRLKDAGRPGEGLPLTEEATRLSELLGDPGLRTDALTQSALVLSALGRDDEAFAALTRATEIAQGLELRWRSDIEIASTVVTWAAGRDDESVAACRRGVELTGGDRPGALPGKWGIRNLNLAEGLLEAGDWEEAARLIDRVLGTPDMSAFISGWADRLGWHLTAWTGDLSPTGWQYDGSDDPGWSDIEVGEIQNILSNRWTRADVAAVTGHVDVVRETLRPVLQQPLCAQAPEFLWPILEVAARVEADVRQRRIAQGAVDGGASHSVVDAVAGLVELMPPRNPRDATFAANVSADLARCEGVEDVRAWTEVVQGWRQEGHPHRVGWTSLRLAEAAVSQEDRVLARDALLEALSVARTLGARPLAEAVGALAHRHRITLPATTRASTDSGPLGLTERELQVLALLADGSSNQEIATRLFISPKTASVHVSHILAELGVTTRTHAAAVAHRSGLAEPRADDPATV